MTNALIGYENLLRNDAATVAASSEQTPVADCYDWRIDDYWQPAIGAAAVMDIDLGAGADCDYLAIYSDDFYLQAGATVELLGGDTFPPTNQLLAPAPISNRINILTFPPSNYRYHRINLAQTASYAPRFQLISYGSVVELEQGLRPGLQPPALGSNNMPSTNLSQNGIFIGRSTQVAPVDFQLSTSVLSAAWIRDSWPAMLDHIERFPFFLLPEPDNYPDECVIAWTRGNIATPRYTQPTFFALDLALSAYL